MDEFFQDSNQVEYPRAPTIYFVVYGVSILAIMGLIIQYCRRRDVGHNRLRREYIV